MHKAKKILAALTLSLVFAGFTEPTASAEVVYSYGGNVFTNTEYVFIRYDGTGQITAQTWYGDNWTYKGKISYTRDNEYVAGPAYTPVACTQMDGGVKETSLTAWDSLNPFAPKTMFYYDWYTVPRNETVC